MSRVQPLSTCFLIAIVVLLVLMVVVCCGVFFCSFFFKNNGVGFDSMERFPTFALLFFVLWVGEGLFRVPSNQMATAGTPNRASLEK